MMETVPTCSRWGSLRNAWGYRSGLSTIGRREEFCVPRNKETIATRPQDLVIVTNGSLTESTGYGDMDTVPEFKTRYRSLRKPLDQRGVYGRILSPRLRIAAAQSGSARTQNPRCGNQSASTSTRATTTRSLRKYGNSPIATCSTDE